MAHNRRVVAVSARLAAAHLPEVRSLLPDGWSAATSQAISGATHTIAISPPVGAVDVSAYLSPPACDGEGGWSVRIHNRTQGVGFPLYTAGGAHAATYSTVLDAAAAAITALRCEIAE
ncbi:hypothetical protein [Phytohabitans rumicis]|nr:hypothetical protein [Phytohabitans rumicis]